MTNPYVWEHDWSSFSKRVSAALPAAEFRRNLRNRAGFLIWTHISFDYLNDPDLPKLLATDLRHADGDYLQILHVYKMRVRSAARAMTRYGIYRVRLGVSIAELYRISGRAWIDWVLEQFAQEDLDVLPDYTFMPPEYTVTSLGHGPLKEEDIPGYMVLCNDGLEMFRHKFPHGIYVENHNEFDHIHDWLESMFSEPLDPGYRQFQRLTLAFTALAHSKGLKVVLGGGSRCHYDCDTHSLLRTFAERGLFRFVDVAGFHNVRGTSGDQVPPPPVPTLARMIEDACGQPDDRMQLVSEVKQLARTLPPDIRKAVLEHLEPAADHPPCRSVPVWLTEYGFPPIDKEQRELKLSSDELEQIQVGIGAYLFALCGLADIERGYFFGYQDVPKEFKSPRFHTTGYEDPLQNAFGVVRLDGSPRLLGKLLGEGGPLHVVRYALKHELFPMVDAASLKRPLTEDYERSIAAFK